MYSVDRYKTRVRARLQSCRNASFYCHPEGLQPRGICFSGATSHSCRVPHSCPRILRTGWASHAEIVAVITVSYPGAPLLSAHFADRVGFTRCWNNRLHYRFVSGCGFSRTATASFYCHPEGLQPRGTCFSAPSQYRSFLPDSPNQRHRTASLFLIPRFLAPEMRKAANAVAAFTNPTKDRYVPGGTSAPDAICAGFGIRRPVPSML